jgi:Flp pilus assembly pilin Flp
MLKFLQDDRGIELPEWGLMAALFGISCTVAIVFLQGGVSAFYNTLSTWFGGVQLPPRP